MTLYIAHDQYKDMPKKDLNQLAHALVRLATGEDKKSAPSAKAVAGRAGGLKGGAVRASKLTDDERKKAASKAAKARWSR